MDSERLARAVHLRHELHAHPELSLHEVETKHRLLVFLQQNTRNLDIVDPGERFFCARYTPADPEDAAKPAIAFRADYDALPICEDLDVAWNSANRGVSHKCGHDGHAATLAGFALELDARGAHQPVVLIFQGAEEIGEGAKVACKILEPQGVGEIYAIHNWSKMERGTVNLVDGATMPASEGLSIFFTGKTSHAAEPENGINPAQAIAALVAALPGFEREAARGGYAMITVVQLSVGSPNFGVNPGEGVVRLTLRAQQDADLRALEMSVRNRAVQLANDAGLSVRAELSDVFPATVNAKACADKVRAAAEAAGLAWHTLPDPSPVRASEDFGYYEQVVPGCLFYMGNGFDYPDVHTQAFDYVDDNIPRAVDVFAQLAHLK